MNAPLIVLTDAPLPLDRSCPTCGAAPELRERSMTFGPVHDVCGNCHHNFTELTVPEQAEEDETW